MQLNILVKSEVSRSSRVKQLSAMFDVPAQEATSLEWCGDFPFDAEPWNIGLIVGPSGCGKSTIAREVFGDMPALEWSAKSVIDDFTKTLSIADISTVCQSVGFNTIPAWMRPFAVLSNGERFRVGCWNCPTRFLLMNSLLLLTDKWRRSARMPCKSTSARISGNSLPRHVITMSLIGCSRIGFSSRQQ